MSACSVAQCVHSDKDISDWLLVQGERKRYCMAMSGSCYSGWRSIKVIGMGDSEATVKPWPG